MHIVAARAVCFREAMTEGFKEYSKALVANAQRLGDVLAGEGIRLVSGGTDNHIVLVDLRSVDSSGDVAENALKRASIVVNMNMIPFDPNPPRRPSGMRLGTPTITSRGMGLAEVEKIGQWIAQIVKDPENESLANDIGTQVRELCSGFPTRI